MKEQEIAPQRAKRRDAQRTQSKSLFRVRDKIREENTEERKVAGAGREGVRRINKLQRKEKILCFL